MPHGTTVIIIVMKRELLYNEESLLSVPNTHCNVFIVVTPSRSAIVLGRGDKVHDRIKMLGTQNY